MKYLKYFNQINEGHITLTADEHKAVERVMKKLPDMYKNKLENLGYLPTDDSGFEFIKNLIDSKSNKILYVDTIDYVTAAGIKSKVGIYIINSYSSFGGGYMAGDINNSEDNIIIINQDYNHYIQQLRTDLIHELIHGKDPRINQKFTDKFDKALWKKPYYKRRTEFEAFTGQILNVISNSTYKFLEQGWSSQELKEIFDDILEYFKDTKQDFIDSFSKQNPDFIKSITEPLIDPEVMADINSGKVPGGEGWWEPEGEEWFYTDYSKIPGIDKYKDRTDLKPNTLRFLNREWDKNKSVNIEEFKDVVYDILTSPTDEIKNINSDYSEFLKDLYKEIKKQVDFVNSKREEKIELNYKTINDWMKDCQSIVYTSRTKIKKVPI